MRVVSRPDLDGRRLQAPGDPNVWLVLHGQRRRIVSSTVYDQLFTDVDRIVVFEHLQEVLAGPDLNEGTCLVRAAGSSAIYLVTGEPPKQTRRHHIADLQSLRDFGFAERCVLDLPSTLILCIPAGGALTSAAARAGAGLMSVERAPAPLRRPFEASSVQSRDRPSRLHLSVGVLSGDTSREALEASLAWVEASAAEAVRRLQRNGVELTVSKLMQTNGRDGGLGPAGWTLFPAPAGAGRTKARNALIRSAFARPPEADFHVMVDAEGVLEADCLYELLVLALNRPQAGLIEAESFPAGRPKDFDPVTLETPWCSAACTLMSRTAFDRTAGFDELFPDGLEEVDLSWRVRHEGLETLTAPGALFIPAYPEPTVRMHARLLAGRLLAHKWDAPDFLAWTEHRLIEEGFATDRAGLPRLPIVQGFERDQENDFDHGFAFARPRWTLPTGAPLTRAAPSGPAAPPRQRVSVVVRTHRAERARLLGRALLSLAVQQNVDVEVVLTTQNFSADELASTERLAREVGARNGSGALRVHNVVGEPGADLRARLLNMGLASASARYVAFLDDDDLVYPDAYRTLLEDLEVTGASAAFGRCVRVMGDLREGRFVARAKDWPFRGESVAELVADNFCPIHSYLLDRERIGADELRFDEDVPYLEDYRLLLRLAAKQQFTFRSMGHDIAEYWFYGDASNTTQQSSDRYSAVAEGYREAYRRTQALKGELALALPMVDIELWAKTRLNGLNLERGSPPVFPDPTDLTIDVARGVRERLRLSHDPLTSSGR